MTSDLCAVTLALDCSQCSWIPMMDNMHRALPSLWHVMGGAMGGVMGGAVGGVMGGAMGVVWMRLSTNHL